MTNRILPSVGDDNWHMEGFQGEEPYMGVFLVTATIANIPFKPVYPFTRFPIFMNTFLYKFQLTGVSGVNEHANGVSEQSTAERCRVSDGSEWCERTIEGSHRVARTKYDYHI